MQENILLGVDILLHVLVNVQMVGRQVGDHRHVRAFPHGNQLEAGKLHHSAVLRLDGLNLRQQGLADIAPQVDGFSLRLQQLGNDRDALSQSIAAGDSIDFAGTQLEKHLHLAGDGSAPLSGGLQLGKMIPHAGCAEDHVLVKIL